MNTKQLVDSVARDTGFPIVACKCVLARLVERITQEVATNGRVKVAGLGVFYSTVRKARTGRNPKNGTPVKVPERKVARFKSGKKFKDKL